MTADPTHRPLTKRVFLEALVCPRRGWLLHNPDAASAAPTLGEQFRMTQGRAIEALALEILGPGVDMHGPATPEWVAEGRRTIENPGVERAYEVPLRAGSAIARPDALIRSAGGWDVVEVKSAKVVKPEYVDDFAYTLAVAARAGLHVTSARLALVNPDWRADNEQPPVVFHDVTERTLARAAEFSPLLDAVHATVSTDQPPPAVLMAACRKCDFRGAACFPEGPAHPVFELPGVRSKRVDNWLAAGITRIADLPETEALNELQRFHRRAVVEGGLVRAPGGLARLADVREPAAYLDFETISLALPPYPGVAPYDVIPVQYSLHRRETGGELTHRDLLVDPADLDLDAFARNLLEALGGAASIVVYSSFERLRLRWLADRLPALAGELEEAIRRLVDLYPIVQASVAHPGFHGSLSIKRVLPVLVPPSDLTYDGLGIGNGDDATGVAGLRAMGRIGDAEWERYRSELLAYCEVDTLAMVRLHEALARLAVNGT